VIPFFDERGTTKDILTLFTSGNFAKYEQNASLSSSMTDLGITYQTSSAENDLCSFDYFFVQNASRNL